MSLALTVNIFCFPSFQFSLGDNLNSIDLVVGCKVKFMDELKLERVVALNIERLL